MILKCNCNHQYQDEKYGEGMRVHNQVPMNKAGFDKVVRCTVCGDEKRLTNKK